MGREKAVLDGLTGDLSAAADVERDTLRQTLSLLGRRITAADLALPPTPEGTPMMSTEDRTPAERVISKMNAASMIVWDGYSDSHLCSEDGLICLDKDEAATVLRICTEDFRAGGEGS